MIDPSLHPWIAVAVTVFIFLGLQLRRGASADILFLAGLVIVTLTGVIDVEKARDGFANRALLTIAGLLVVAAGLRTSGVLDWIGQTLLGSVSTEAGALRRISGVVVAASAFLLNTALVAMLMPVFVDWCRRRNLAVSRLLIPLSYLAILGGVCTLVGTSTTLVINGILVTEHQQREADLESAETKSLPLAQQKQRHALVTQIAPMSLFEIGRVGLPCALVGMVFLVGYGWKLLPKQSDVIDQLGEQRREYLLEMLVMPECRLIDQSVQEAGLRALPGLFLIEIDRDGDIITPVTPEDTFHSGDRLVFTGVVSTIVDLEKIPGLVPAADTTYEFHPQSRSRRHLTEVVLSRTSPLIGRTVREANFRQLYNAAVVAVHRNGVRLTNKIGSISLEPGDTLLLQTRNEFVPRYRNSRDFYLVSSVEGSEPRRHDKAPLAGGIALLLVVWLSLTSFLDPQTAGALASPAFASLAAAVLMVLSGCLPLSEARASIDLQVLLTIAAALGVGSALTESGAANAIATTLVAWVSHPYMLLIVVYLLTMLMTEMITNVAVAAMLLPLAIAVAVTGGHNPRPFIMAISLAASLSFLTPVGYQTNLMVLGPGGYKARDYLRAGLPLAILVAITALILIPRIWPLELTP